MSEQKIVVGLDLGTHRIAALVAELDENGNQRVLGLGTAPSQGIRSEWAGNFARNRERR